MSLSGATLKGESHLNRRDFLERSILGGVSFCALSGRARAGLPETGSSPLVAFNTANLVGQVTGYRYQLSNWMDQHAMTVAATNSEAWRAICNQIAESGFKAVEIWEAHASPETLDRAKAAEWKQVLSQAGLEPIAYAGRFSADTARICEWLEIPHVDGGLGKLNPDEATSLCRETGIRFNIENHPEKSPEEILAKVDGGNDWLGVCIDTGWLATQGVPGPNVVRACGSLVRHTHIKDVKRSGEHETCLLGEGVADLEGCLEALREVGYQGVYSWEDEPEDRNPFESARRNLDWIRRRV